MAENKDREVAGFIFDNEEDAAAAREEVKKIYYIRTRLNSGDTESILTIYNRLVETRVFRTPVGFVFLNELYNRLIADESVEGRHIAAIPVDSLVISESVLKGKLPQQKIKPRDKSNYFAQYTLCRLIILVLLVAVVAMFYITLHSDNPNILNYETAIENKYASWAQELKDKESALKERERALEEAGY